MSSPTEDLFPLKPIKPSSSKGLAIKLSHAKRRALGIPVPGRKSHDRLMSTIYKVKPNDKD